ncbi:ATP-grasp domain-containing protein [Saccharopolyspora sp. NPDC002578]
MVAHVFVLGLDERNRETLRGLPALADCELHPLLDVDRLVHVDEIDLPALLEEADRELNAFDGRVDAIVGYWDFPVSSLVPILCERRGLPGADLRAVVLCEHKYWSRVVQAEVIDDVPRFGLVHVDEDTAAPDGVRYPLWVKPVKSFSSQMAYRVTDDEGFRAALAEIQEGIDKVGKPFEDVLARLDLPREIAEAGGRSCVAEEAVSGRQITVEGYDQGDGVHLYGVIDTVNYPGTSSFLRYQYPSSLPADVVERITADTRRVIEHIGLRHVPFNVEFFWDEDSGAVHLLEINARHSQSHAPMFEDVDGVPNHQVLVQLGLGRDPDFPHRQGEHAISGKWFYRTFEDGWVRRAPTDAEIAALEREHPGVRVHLMAEEGERLSELPDQDSYSYELAHLYIGAGSEQEFHDTYERCTRALPFEIERRGGDA